MTRLPVAILLLAAAADWCCATARAQSPDEVKDPLVYAGPPRKQDEVLLINTRELAEPGADDKVELPLLRYNEQGKWESLTIEALVRDSQAEVPTLFYIHGYDFDEEKAESVGWAMYHALCDKLPAQERVRYVIWSWPSIAKRFRLSRDVVEKSLRSDVEGYWLAWLIAQLPSTTRVGIVSSALGCRAAEGALHYSGGGEIHIWKVARRDGNAGPPIRAVFISPAMHDFWLYPGEFHERALDRTQSILLLNNPQDPTLINYRRAWEGSPAALGLDGLPSVEKFGELATRIQQIDAHEIIGENHGVEHYLRSAELTAKMRAHLLDK